ncbi:MAG: APC family permease [Acidobacteriaceae bacterium]|nr:APC family permease [Acidobacteriaceae bacterium]
MRNGDEASSEKRLGLLDATMIVAGSMVGSGIFLVTAQMARDVSGAGWLMLAWGITTALTLAAALSYGELAAMMPLAGGQYVFLREAYSRFWAFLYGWTLFFIMQTGLIDAVTIGFARYLGVLWPAVAEDHYLVAPIALGKHYALSLSTTQLTALLLIVVLSWVNARGVDYGKLVQNVFTLAKLGALVVVIAFGLLVGCNHAVIHANYVHAWQLSSPAGAGAPLWWKALVAVCVAQVGSLFAADAWNNVTFVAGEIRRPQRNLPLALLLGTGGVMLIYIGANLAYTFVLPMQAIQSVPADRVGAAMLNAIYPRYGSTIMAVLILVAAAGCVNGIILSGSRTFATMARDGLFLESAAKLNRAGVPGVALWVQAAWAVLLLLVRTHDPVRNTYGNLYSNLLDYVISAALFFYVLTVAAVWRLRRKRPEAERPYKTWGYPLVPGVYCVFAGLILLVLCWYRAATALPGFGLIACCAVVYFLLYRRASSSGTRERRAELQQALPPA